MVSRGLKTLGGTGCLGRLGLVNLEVFFGFPDVFLQGFEGTLSLQGFNRIDNSVTLTWKNITFEMLPFSTALQNAVFHSQSDYPLYNIPS